jgi:hypothetical protein
VLPGQFGLAVCRKISADYSLHTLHTGSVSVSSVIHATYDASQVSSKRARNATQLAALAARGKRATLPVYGAADALFCAGNARNPGGAVA